jgi:hypothetical protein
MLISTGDFVNLLDDRFDDGSLDEAICSMIAKLSDTTLRSIRSRDRQILTAATLENSERTWDLPFHYDTKPGACNYFRTA